ncbi:MAG: hypothetical protein RR619_06680, partial [Raoultibacter sp.]
LMPGLIRPKTGFQFWSLVELETVWPWFHVETIDWGGNRPRKGIVLAPNVQLLRDLIGCGNKTARVNQVQIVTPGAMNGTGSWKMEVLEELYEVIDSKGQVSGHDYQVAGGFVYSTVVDKDVSGLRKLIHSSVVDR